MCVHLIGSVVTLLIDYFNFPVREVIEMMKNLFAVFSNIIMPRVGWLPGSGQS